MVKDIRPHSSLGNLQRIVHELTNGEYTVQFAGRQIGQSVDFFSDFFEELFSEPLRPDVRIISAKGPSNSIAVYRTRDANLVFGVPHGESIATKIAEAYEQKYGKDTVTITYKEDITRDLLSR